jgi:hypothetical protein
VTCVLTAGAPGQRRRSSASPLSERLRRWCPENGHYITLDHAVHELVAALILVDVRNDAIVRPAGNNCVSVGAVYPDSVLGELRRRKANFARLLAVIVDDLRRWGCNR